MQTTVLEQYERLPKSDEQACLNFVCNVETALKRMKILKEKKIGRNVNSVYAANEKEAFLTLLLNDLKTRSWSEKCMLQTDGILHNVFIVQKKNLFISDNASIIQYKNIGKRPSWIEAIIYKRGNFYM